MLMKLLIFDFNITKFFKFFPFLCMLSKIYVFSKFIIFHFFSYFSGNNLESLKIFFTFQEIKLFYLMLKKLPFCFQENRQDFSFLIIFISSCFYFFMFLFLQMFLLLIAFVHFTFFSLCLSGTLFLCCYRECYGFEGGFFTLHSFLLLSRLPGGGSSVLKIAGSKLRFH